MWKILILHGPNLNLFGKREPDIYGNLSLDDIDKRLVIAGHELCMEVRAYQSNVEGVLIDQVHAAREWASGVIINPGGYTHTSVALRDAESLRPAHHRSPPHEYICPRRISPYIFDCSGMCGDDCGIWMAVISSCLDRNA